MSKKQTNRKTQHQVEQELGEEGDDEAVKRAVGVSLVVLLSLIILAGGAYGVYSFLNRNEVAVTNVKKTGKAKVREEDVSIPTVRFVDITSSCGVDFQHVNGFVDEKLLPQTMGGGVAFIDYDNDGDQDLFFVNANYWDRERPAGEAVPTMQMYCNDGTGNFSNTTAEVGLAASFYGMGVAVGDYDNDGWRDLYVTAVGENRLFRNEKGQFKDVTETAGVAGMGKDWGSSCGFFDYNNDGRLELFVCNYLDWSAKDELSLEITLTGQIPGYAKPQIMPGTFPYLFRNEGDGTFTDVSEESGIQIVDPHNKRPLNKSLGLSFVDVNGDGWQDVFVANDTVRNLLLVNQKDGTFLEDGERSNIAYDDKGNARGAMGIDAARFRSDDSLGFIIGNFALEPASLYVKQGNNPIFTDESIGTGLGPETRIELTFGMFFFDYDLDGRLDILTANGHLEEEIQMKFKRQTYLQAPHLFWNAGEEQRSEFVTVDHRKCGKDLCKPIAGRGLAYADIDSDGDLDVVITAVGSHPRILRNDLAGDHHWLEVSLDAGKLNRYGYGSTIAVFCGDKKMERFVSPTRSYLSQTQIPAHFGLGENASIDRIVVTWPDGQQQELVDVKADQRLTVAKQSSDPN